MSFFSWKGWNADPVLGWVAGGQTLSTSQTKLEAVTLPSSAFGITIPVVGGVARLPANYIDYFNFIAHPHTETQGGKGGVETANTSYSYSVSLLMGICHGRAYAGQIWKGKEVHAGGWSAGQVLRQPDTYTVPGSGAMTKTLTHGTTAIGSPFVTYAGAPWKQILSEGSDYSLTGGVLTVLKDEWRGKLLNIGYQYGNGTYSHAGMTTLGMSATTGDVTQSVPAWITADNPSHALNYPGLVYAHAQDYDLGNISSVEPHSFEMLGFGAYRYGSSKPDCNIAEFVAWVLTNSVFGAGLPSGALEVQSWIDYCAAAGLLMSPALTTQLRAGDLLQRACELTNSRVVQSYDRIRVLPLCEEVVTGNGVTYTPNVTPVYDLTDDFMIGTPPFSRALKIPEDRYNHCKVEYNDRASYYNKSIVEVSDDGDIALNGRRTKPTVSAPWICDGEVARLVGQLIMQRDLNIAGGGTCRLPWAFVLLDVGDLVTVTDPILGDEPWNMRITQLDEDEHGYLTCAAEDWPLGTASATAYTAEIPGGYLHDYFASPGSVDAPAIFEGPAELAGTTGVEVYVGARGANANYGGCHVWVSYDGTEYKKMGTIFGDSRYGTLQNSVTSGSTTFRINGLTDAELKPGSADDAANLETLCYVGGANLEFFAHQGATLISAGVYDLSGLVRGAYASAAASHAGGVPFARLDDRVARSGPLGAALVGTTIYIKCLAFNIYGRAEQSLSDATAYGYAVTGIPAGYKPGVGGKGVDLKTSSLTFQYPKAGGVNPGSITLTAVRKGALSGAVTFSVVAGTATLVGTGDSRTLAPADLSTDTATIRASITDGVGTYTSDATISKVREGADGSQFYEAHTSNMTWLNGVATKASGSAAWDGSIRSTNVYAGGATATWVSDTDDKALMVGLNPDPATDNSYASINYALYLRNDGVIGVYESSVSQGTFGSYAIGDTFAVTYDGNDVAYYHNGAAFKTTPAAANLRLCLDSSFNTVGGAVSSLAYGSQGGKGSDAPLLTLSQNKDQFTYDGDGARAPSSQTITYIAVLQNVSGTASFTCTLYDATNTSLGTVTLGGSGNTRTLSGSQFDSLGSTVSYAKVVATLGSLTDETRAVKTRDGTNNVVAKLTNYACTFPADSSGDVSDFSTGVTRMLLEIGGVDDSVAWSYSEVDSTGITAALGSGANENLLTVTGMTAGVDSGTCTITATKAGYPNQVLVFTIAKSKSAPGTTGLIDGLRVTSSDVEVGNSSDATARVVIETDGGITYLTNDTSQTELSWWFPHSAGIGTGKWFYANVAGPDGADVTGPMNTWTEVTADKTFELKILGSVSPVVTKIATVYITWANSSGGAATGFATFNLVANRDT